MNERTAALVTWGGGAVIAAASVAALVLTVVSGEAVFAARLIAGFAGCL